MKWREQHEAFKKLAIQRGICRVEEFEQALPFGCEVPDIKIQKWLNNLLLVPKTFSAQRRYINRFKLGADPEFVFAHAGERTDARYLGLAQGLAFGMDNNGRLTEIRPFASRSALEVVASVRATLQWMAILRPDTLKYEWQSGAYLYGDGLGGHVHFGRKRPNRNLEVSALDVLNDELMAIGVYNQREVARRRGGDQHHQLYGLPGDIRPQVHGYEYRTFPSWLDSPALAFLTLVLSKIAVHNPTLLQGYIPLKEHGQRLRNLLAYYKDVDDDARLALRLLCRGVPTQVGGDFKERWGIGAGQTRLDIKFIPKSIKPTSLDIKEMFEHIAEKVVFPFRDWQCNWSPAAPPVGYEMMIEKTQTMGAKGLGELIYDVVQSKERPCVITNVRGRYGASVFFGIPRDMYNLLPGEWLKKLRSKIVPSDDAAIHSEECKRGHADFAEARRLLLETALPFWKINEVKVDSYAQWKSSLRPRPKTEYVDKLIYGDVRLLPKLGGY